MAGNLDIEKLQREEARWRILVGLKLGSPGLVSETILLRLVSDDDLNLSAKALRVQLDYLRDRGLIDIHNERGPVWTASLTRHGYDIVEYTVDCDPGIARPDKWY